MTREEQVQHDKDGFMFRDRQEAARLLTVEIEKRIKGRDFIIAAILRGGIVLGKIIADYFKVPLEPLVIRKIGAPNEKELAIGAVGPKGTIYWDKDLMDRLNIDKAYKTASARERFYELEELENTIRKKRNALDFAKKKVIVVDDGVATGTTVFCASVFLKKEKTESIVLATPVIAEDTFEKMDKYFDKVIALKVAPNFYAVGQFYKYFPQVEDEEVVTLMSS